jgi:hypothetical protein
MFRIDASGRRRPWHVRLSRCACCLARPFLYAQLMIHLRIVLLGN